jgi:hypothetical protein
MKKHISLTILLCIVTLLVFAQPDTALRYFSDRYKLDIPEEWKKKKMIDAITEILPQTFSEYIDEEKQFCIDCKAGLTVMLVIDKPVFDEKKNTYQFRASLALFDTTGKGLIELMLVDTNEVFQSRVKISYPLLPPSAYNNQGMGQQIPGPNGTVAAVVKIPAPPIINNVPNFGNEGAPIMKLVGIAEDRIYKVRDILEELRKKEQKKD